MAYKHYLQISEQRRLLRHRGTYSTQKTLCIIVRGRDQFKGESTHFLLSS